MINLVSTGVVRWLDCMRVLSQLQQFPLFPNCFVFNAFSKFIRDIRTWSFRESGSSEEDGQTVGTVTPSTAQEILLVHVVRTSLKVLSLFWQNSGTNTSASDAEFLTAGFRSLLDQKLRQSAHKNSRDSSSKRHHVTFAGEQHQVHTISI